MTRPLLLGPSVWLGADIRSDPRWQSDLPAAALAEIDAALRQVQREGLAWHAVTRDAFPLPKTAALLAQVAEELENGRGMVKLRGLPVGRYDETELRQIYFGLASHLGQPVFQNRRGELMRDIRDEGADVGRRYGQIEGKAGENPFLSSYARTLTNGRLRFHTDRTDVVGLLCVRQAKTGGVSKLCSSPAVHNAMLQRRPELAEELFQDIWRSRMGEETDAVDVVYPLPIFGVRDGRFTSHYSLTYIEAAQKAAGVAPLTATQREAIDMLMALAEELSFEMTLEPGDLQLVNSHVTYHGRTPFEDDHASGRDRLLMRVWLSMPNSRALPEGHEVLWGSIAAGARRGGIGQVATS